MSIVSYIDGQRVETFKGCVLDTWERNGYDDSDFYAEVWNEQTQSIECIEYDTTRYAMCGSAKIDVTTEVARKVYKYYKNRAMMSVEKHLLAQRKYVSKGRFVEVIRGRKVPKGTIGVVFWTGQNYNRYTRRMDDKVGIKTENETLFVPLEYVHTIDGQNITLSAKERNKFIKRTAFNNCGRHVRTKLMA